MSKMRIPPHAYVYASAPVPAVAKYCAGESVDNRGPNTNAQSTMTTASAGQMRRNRARRKRTRSGLRMYDSEIRNPLIVKNIMRPTRYDAVRGNSMRIGSSGHESGSASGKLWPKITSKAAISRSARMLSRRLSRQASRLRPRMSRSKRSRTKASSLRQPRAIVPTITRLTSRLSAESRLLDFEPRHRGDRKHDRRRDGEQHKRRLDTRKLHDCLLHRKRPEIGTVREIGFARDRGQARHVREPEHEVEESRARSAAFRGPRSRRARAAAGSRSTRACNGAEGTRCRPRRSTRRARSRVATRRSPRRRSRKSARARAQRRAQKSPRSRATDDATAAARPRRRPRCTSLLPTESSRASR